ncbi:nickel-binding protein [Pelagibius marinus]|uniref:nickel-binding protein n=1 Tax=Pelagibius marinus TaxID=2762760 RepID=UPI001872EA97|nr:nickel-binding protein [Pelagibius marinus]
MPIFLDRHDVGEASAEDIAELHIRDLEIQDKYGVRFLTYWYDSERRTTFCLVDAPDKAMADRVHAEAHGHVANEMIAVELSAVEAFLGRIQDPPAAKAAPLDDSAFRAIMFTDMVGSTEMTEQLGDTMALELLRAHDAIIRRSLEQHGGSEVKHLGDGIMASFNDVPASVACAMRIQEELGSYNESSKTPIHVRIGIHAGDPVEESNDLFGSAVQMAARICGLAQANTVLVSHEVRNACNGGVLGFESLGAQTLKGFSEPVQLYTPAR